jgi:glycosyltransferase involved in cell wall biosynthesis
MVKLAMTSDRSPQSVLFVSAGPSITRPESGEGTRLNQLSRRLANDWNVFTLVPESEPGPPPEWVTEQHTYRQWSFPYLTDLNPTFVRAMHRVLSREEIDIVHGSVGVCAVTLATLLDGDTTSVYAAQNVEADHVRNFVNPDLPTYKRLLAPVLVPLLERLVISCADAVTTVSEKDRARFIERYGVSINCIRAIPTGTETVDPANLDPPSVVRERYDVEGALAVFHGYYQHYPNREAAEIIDDTIAPAILDAEIDVEFLLVGKDPPEVSSPNVTAVGFVDDLYSVLGVADLAVVPIRHGGGTKTKVYDYVTLGVPMVATEKAVEGIDIDPGRHAVVTEGVDEEFVDGVQQLVTDQDAAQRMSDSLRSLADSWDWERSVTRLEEFYRSL